MPDGPRARKDRKDSQLIIRIKGTDRDDFVALCEALDTSAAREIRRFIREFVQSHNEVADVPTVPNADPEEEPEEWPRKRKSKRSKKK